MNATPTATEPIGADTTGVTAWERAVDRLAAGQWYWLTTVRPGGVPHVRPVLAVWADGALHFSTSPGARKGRNLAADQHCTVTLETESMHLVVEGLAVRVRDDARLERVGEEYGRKYGWPVRVREGAFDADYGAPTAGPPPYEVYRVEPARAYGFPVSEETPDGEEAVHPTRWRF